MLARFRPVWDKPDEGGSGGGDGDNENTGGGTEIVEGGDTGTKDADDQNSGEGGEGGDTGDDDVALSGGTAEGQDNSGEGEGDGDNDGDGEGENTGVPEAYDFSELELPEGMQLDEQLAETMSPAFREAGLTQEQASTLAKAYAGQMQASAEASADAAKQLVGGWLKDAKADKEVGLNNWKGSVDAANAVIRKFGTPELVNDVMVGQGIGNHPEMVRLLARIGKAIGDDQLITGEQTDTGDAVSQETVWYGKTTPESKKG